ncbi:hypothetical protein [Enterovibrio norvegicus]|uniref:hypothetical protein n=1 Tax=Enterovibrio norvegicus TaxID=188144 RepID=UPI0010555E97|nr:hypothetical protein [Enterovibrio norvegicus]
MFSRLVVQSICCVMLFVVSISTTSFAIGEFQSHNPVSAIELEHGHGHVYSHHHGEETEHPFHHDASNHSHDKAHFNGSRVFVICASLDAQLVISVIGLPIRTPFQIERPPKLPLFA